ncbi:MAG: DVU_1553 family AMP-dependent CoA ligase [bacterium]|jgi:phenylacetate-CoA ligase
MKRIRKTPLEAWVEEKIRPYPDLQSYRLAKLRETLAHARAKSPFYRERLADFKPEDIKNTGDLQGLPLTRAGDIAANPLSFVAVSQDEIERIVTLNTSGTTGDCKRVFFTREDIESTMDFFWYGMSTLVGPGDRFLILLPWERPASVGDLLIKALGPRGVEVIPYGPIDDYNVVAQVIAREKITSLVGIPTQVLGLAKFIQSQWPGFVSPLRTMLLTTDYVSPAVVQYIERTLHCQVFNHYGMTEMGFGGAVDCSAHQGCHLREADLYVEIVDPATGKAVPPGSVGEIVFTTLTRRGMPLIRYATGDLAYFIPGPCPCGTYLARMGIVKDRREGRVVLPGGEILSMAKLDDILFPLPLVVDFAALVREGGGGVELVIRFLLLEQPPGELPAQAEKKILTEFPQISKLVFELEVSQRPWKARKRMLLTVDN